MNDPSVMLCFVQGFEGNKEEINGNKEKIDNVKNGVEFKKDKEKTEKISPKEGQVKEPRLQIVKNKFLKKSRSSGNFGSAGARSAPSTPQGVYSACNSSLGLGPASPGGLVIHNLASSSSTNLVAEAAAAAAPSATSPGGGAVSQPCTPGCSSPSIHRSPSHSVFTKCDKSSLKHLSTSTPAMTAQAQLAEPPSPKPTKKTKVPTISKGHQRNFLRHFPNVDDEEKVLNHYSCALIGDILLQGHLYITKNYFAFYSNVFGYVTKLLIPVMTVENITKEKTARIIPNAVGIATSEDKHVFGSLMSRDNTLQFMNKVWEVAKSASPQLPVPEPEPDPECESTETGEGESGRESPMPEIAQETTFKKCEKEKIPDSNSCERSSSSFIYNLQQAICEFSKLPRQNLILFATTLLLILLFLSAGVLLYRISRIQNKYSIALQDQKDGIGGEDIYSNLLQWQSHLHHKSAGAVNDFLDSNLDQIAKVRQSLEALSTLLLKAPAKSAEDPKQTTSENCQKSTAGDVKNDNSQISNRKISD